MRGKPGVAGYQERQVGEVRVTTGGGENHSRMGESRQQEKEGVRK